VRGDCLRDLYQAEDAEALAGTSVAEFICGVGVGEL
jgi:hypothetical protein